MKKTLLLFLCLILLLPLTVSCSTDGQRHDAADYILETPYKDDFRILTLTDIHLSVKDDRQLHFDFMDLTIDETDPDMIVLLGDTFTFADKAVAKSFFDWLDGHGIPWGLTFGNHDEQCYFSVDWLTDYLNGYGSNCLFLNLQDDDVYGDCNYAVNLKDGDATVAQVIVMDSNRYNYGEYVGYDYIKPDQIDWYERLVTATTDANGGTPVPSVLFMHIPLPEYLDAYEEAVANGDVLGGEKREAVCSPEYNSGLFDKLVALGSTKAVVVGHDHINDFRAEYRGIVLSYAVTATDRVYADADMMGGQTVTIHRDGTLTFEQVFHTYEEVAK